MPDDEQTLLIDMAGNNLRIKLDFSIKSPFQ